MSNAPYDPYQPPRTVEPKPAAPMAAGIRYMYAYNYVFENPNWMTNIMYGFLCMIIPIVGPLVFSGYQFEIVESFCRFPGRGYPDFDFGKFSNYLMRGIWPFLVSLVLVMPMVLVIWIVMFVGFMILGLVASAAGEDAGGIVFAIGVLFFVIVMMALSLGMGLIMQPIMLRAGLSQDFGQAFKLGWAFDFIKRVWFEMVLFQLFFMVTAMPLAMLGYMACIIGMYAAMALILLAQANMLYQLYNLYLARGGEPIPLKEPPPPQNMVYGT